MQKYLFFFNNRFIYFTESETEVQNMEGKNNQIFDLQIISNFNYGDFLRDESLKSLILIFSKNKMKDLRIFLKCFRIIKAAGGIVQNPEREFLLIFRHGVWDLPKGKGETGEDMCKTAVREVEEECRINNLKVKSFNSKTYHIYKFKEEWILKKTYWYNMYIEEHQNPIPQIEEDITSAEWINAKKLNECLYNTYPNIKLLLEQYVEK